MNDIILVLLGVAAGTYFAEPIRSTVTVLDPNKRDKAPVQGPTKKGS